MAREEVVVWRAVGEEKRVCEFGAKHRVRIWASKKLGPVVATADHDNGYEIRKTEIREDRQGRWYHQHIAIDYFNNISWLRLNDKVLFSGRPTHSDGDIDVLGRPV